MMHGDSELRMKLIDQMERFTRDIFIEKIINEQFDQPELIKFLDGAIFIASLRGSLPQFDWDSITSKYVSKYFPKKLDIQNYGSSFIGATSLLVSLKLLYKEKYYCIKAYESIKQQIFYSLDIDIPLLYRLANERKIISNNYDLILGISSLLNYLLEDDLGKIRNEEYISKIIDFLLYLTTFEKNIPKKMVLNNVYGVEIESNDDEYISIGISHGLLGIYYVFSKYLKVGSYEKYTSLVKQRLIELENFIFKIENNSFLLPEEEYYPNSNNHNPLKNQLNFSWCYGTSGYMSTILDNSYQEWSLFYGMESCIRKKMDTILSCLIEDKDNIIYYSTTFCHGLSGKIYELFLFDNLKYEKEIEYLLKKILASKVDDMIAFYDVEDKDNKRGYETGFHVLDGSLGTWIVINSILNLKRFNGDFIFGKL